ncbi:hypothetical protein V2O64_19455 [Verrucomicrobiaceae bacterium 227]
MLDIPLRVGVSGSGKLAHAIAFQVKTTPGMDLQWLNDTFTPESPVDVFVEASDSVEKGVISALDALNRNTHVVLTNPAVDLIAGPLLAATAYQNGLIVTSDAGTRHGALATLIQEAGIMGFDIIQAACCSHQNSTRLNLELAVLANAFGFQPPAGGMTGPPATALIDALHAFDLNSYGEIPRVDFLTGDLPQGTLYLIVKPKENLPPEQISLLQEYHLGDGPHYLLHRPYYLGHLETPKAILGAAAGQAILSSGHPTCDVYAHATQDLKAGTTITNALQSGQIHGRIAPLNSDGIPIALLNSDTVLKTDLTKDQPLTFDDLNLPDCQLTHLWIQQQDMLEQT